jgi:hypothetical protein
MACVKGASLAGLSDVSNVQVGARKRSEGDGGSILRNKCEGILHQL